MKIEKELKSIYISNMMKKRHREKTKIKDRVNFVIYDLDRYRVFQDIVRREGSDVSSILNNLYESFLEGFDTPQTTIDLFATEKTVPLISAGPATWRKYLESLNKDEYDKLDQYLNTLLFLHNKRGREPFG